ncbi:hypothetical protein [Anabaena azotica]|uniref:hypothetical protein n=1 Tax=Anabaena azotica TaxID=197653 RepID=UPI0039A452AF
MAISLLPPERLLRIRVHPAIGQQGMEELYERLKHDEETYSEEERNAMGEASDLAMQQPDFWEKQAEIIEKRDRDSKELIEWYRKRKFIHDDPDGKHLWFYPE